MRILLTNSDMLLRGGTQVWIATMAAELMRRGHDVRLLTLHGNAQAPWIPDHRDGATYDVALVNHNDAFAAARRIDIGTLIYTAHGFTPAVEWAPPGADAYVAVDELTGAHVPYPTTIIRNPIDLDRFRPTTDVAPDPRRAIFLSNKQGRARTIIEKACDIAGIELKIVGGDTSSDTPEVEMNWSDIVFTIGRGVPEALACNRNVYVMDLYGAKGYVRPDNVEHLRLDSYAGLLGSRWPTPEQLADEVRDGYDPLQRMRDYVVAEHAPETVADRYLDVATRVPRLVRLASRALRRIGGPLISRRTTKALSNARLVHPGAAMSALRGAQDLPPLLPSKLPDDVRLTFPDEGLRPT